MCYTSLGVWAKVAGPSSYEVMRMASGARPARTNRRQVTHLRTVPSGVAGSAGLHYRLAARRRLRQPSQLSVSLVHATPPGNEKTSLLGRWFQMAERQGFEPWLPGSPVKRFSRPPHSTALPPLREVISNQLKWRRDGDLNPGYAFGVYTISNRAPSASSDIPPSQFERRARAADRKYTSPAQTGKKIFTLHKMMRCWNG